MTALALLAGGLALALLLTLLGALAYLRRVRELHHGYYGAALVAAGRWCLVHGGIVTHVVGVLLIGGGLYLLLDDLEQHVVEAAAKWHGAPIPNDFTPVHRLGARVVQRWRDADPHARHVAAEALALLALLAAVGGYAVRHPVAPAAAPAARAAVVTADSLARTQPADSAAVAHHAARSDSAATVARDHVLHARPARRAADSLRAVGDTITGDSAGAWRARYVVTRAEADSLRVVVAQQDTTIDALVVARQEDQRALGVQAVRLAALEQLRVALIASLDEKKKPPARRLHWRPCLFGGAEPTVSTAGIGVRPAVGGGACVTYDRG